MKQYVNLTYLPKGYAHWGFKFMSSAFILLLVHLQGVVLSINTNIFGQNWQTIPMTQI